MNSRDGLQGTAYRCIRLPHRDPQEETAKGAPVEQGGLSLLLPRGIVRAWESYQVQRDGTMGVSR